MDEKATKEDSMSLAGAAGRVVYVLSEECETLSDAKTVLQLVNDWLGVVGEKTFETRKEA